MSILIVRRICQVFFLILFMGFCAVTALGEKEWQLRGWPVNWFLELDPLAGIGTLLAARTLYKGLIWGLVAMGFTILLGRFFCGWVCPFGTLHQFVGYLANRKKSMVKKIEANRDSPWQSLKYWILVFMLAAAAANLSKHVAGMPENNPGIVWAAVAALFLGIFLVASIRDLFKKGTSIGAVIVYFIMAAGLIVVLRNTAILQSSLLTGLLDPIPLFQRSVNLILLPLLDEGIRKLSAASRHYQGAWLIGGIFLTAIFLNLYSPRFYCRYVCPLGALFALLNRHSLWRIGKTTDKCADCKACDAVCEGACSPSSRIVWGECILCLKCIKACQTHEIAYRTQPSEGGEILLPDLARRGFVLSLISGAAAIPMVRIGDGLAVGWNPTLIRPPGAFPEPEFLSRCVRCGQCMRICPTNVIQPAVLEGGLEGVWTPNLNFRIGSSGCQHNCIACGHLCPTSAIRPLSFDERFGRNEYVDAGPIRIGTAFIDRGRCLPWAMGKPCIVCQESCPVSPKAIFTREHFGDLRFFEALVVREASRLHAVFNGASLAPGRLETGDYYCIVEGAEEPKPRRILENGVDRIEIHPEMPWRVPPSRGSHIHIKIRLQQPYVDIDHCIGCGVCEHECPVSGKRAIRVTAENESRNPKHALTLTTRNMHNPSSNPDKM